jgi:hypothetical protein
MTPSPPLTALPDLGHQLAGAGYAVLDADAVFRLAGNTAAQMGAWLPLWDDLPLDAYLKDGGRYRRRRHGSFVIEGDDVRQAAHRAHWQPVSYNALHGGIERWFEPLPQALTADPAWARLLRALARTATALRGAHTWFAEAHSFRIDTEGGIGRPTPEGAHRDGVDLVAVMLVSRVGIKGAETRVFDARGPQGVRFTLTQPFSTLLLDDERVVHESTPIQPLDAALPAYRDTLVVTLRSSGFQDPTTPSSSRS